MHFFAFKTKFFPYFSRPWCNYPQNYTGKAKKYPNKPAPIIHTPIDRDADIVYNGDNNDFKGK